MDNTANNFIFFAIFNRIIFISPLIFLLIVCLWFGSFVSLIYWIWILALIYLLFFAIRDAFLKEKGIQDSLRF